MVDLTFSFRSLVEAFSRLFCRKKKGIAMEVPVWTDRFVFGGGLAQRVGRVEGKGWSLLGVLPLQRLWHFIELDAFYK